MIASAYGKDSGTAQFIESSDLLYLDPHRNRTERWLQGLGLQLPSDIASLGSIGTVTYQDGNVKIEGVPYQQYMRKQSENSNKQFSLSDTQEDIDKAVELLDNGSTPSEAFSQTGLVVMANGDIYNGIGGEKIGVYQHGGAKSDAGRMGSGVQIARPGDNRGRDREALAGTEAPVRRKGWEELGNGEKIGVYLIWRSRK